MNNNSKLLVSFLAGAAAGVAVAYLMTSDKGGELVDELRNMANKVRDNIANRMGGDKSGFDDFGVDSSTYGTSGTSQEDYMGV